MRRSLCLVSLAGLLGGCSVTVVGNIGNGRAELVGTASGEVGLTLGHDRPFTITGKDGLTCEGTFRRLESEVKSFYVGRTLVRPVGYTPHYGIAAFHCTDGTAASLRIRELNQTQGWGTGKTNEGEPVAMTYGLAEREARMYLLLPVDDPNEPASDRPSSPPASGSPSGPPQSAPESKTIGPRGSGTGFFINAQGYLVTNAHVVRDCEYMQVRTADGTQYRGEILYSDVQTDLAAVRVPLTPPPAVATLPATSKYRIGDDVLAFGFPYGSRKTLSSSGVLTTGTISALTGLGDDSSRMQINAGIEPGNSGGPLADKYGHVIGVNVERISDDYAKKATGQYPQNVNFSIKEMMVKSFLTAHAISYVANDRTVAMSNADVAEEMRQYTGYLVCYGYPHTERKKER